MSDNLKQYHTNFKSFIGDLTEQDKSLRADLSSFKENIGKGANTIELEKKIKNAMKQFKDLLDKLNEAYLSKNIPGTMADNIVDARQKEIKKFKTAYDEINKDFLALNDDKYSFKGQITEDYKNKEEYKGKSTEELLQVQKSKLNQQSEQIAEITQDAKKGTVLAKNLQHEFQEQTKKINQVNEDMDILDNRMNKLSDRFEKYIDKSSGCCIMFFFILEAIIFGVLIWVYTCVEYHQWTC